MGIPYSTQIATALDQVEPLVAEGFKALETTRTIFILLAIIQVLTCVFLALMLAVLILLVYCVNPDLEKERQELVTPFFRRLARVTVLGVFESAAAAVVGFGGFVVRGFVRTRQMGHNYVEKEGDQDADGALEDVTGKEKENAKMGKKATDT